MKVTTKNDSTREEKEVCSYCGCSTELVYDLFGDGLVLYCEDCYIQWLAQHHLAKATKKLK